MTICPARRIASPEMLPTVDLLPYAICSPTVFASDLPQLVGFQAGQGLRDERCLRVLVGVRAHDLAVQPQQALVVAVPHLPVPSKAASKTLKPLRRDRGRPCDARR